MDLATLGKIAGIAGITIGAVVLIFRSLVEQGLSDMPVRNRASAAAGRRVEGRKPTLIGDALALARRLRRKNPRTGERRSLRDIAAVLAEAGHVNPETGKPYSAEAIRLALARPAQIVEAAA